MRARATLLSRPTALGTWVLAGLVMALASNEPVVRATVVLAAWVLLARRLVPGRRLRPLAIGVSILVALTVSVNGLLSHTGATVIARLPAWLPLLGGRITLQAFVFGAGIAAGLAAAVSVSAALSLVIEPSDLVDGLPPWLARTGAALGAALNLVPAIASRFVSVRDTQRLRGWRPRGARGVVDLVVPVLLGAMDTSLQLAEAMEARAFASGTRVGTYGTLRGSANLAVALGSVLALGAFVTLRLVGATGTWYPYPTLVSPAFGPAALGPPALLVLVALVVPAGPA